MSAVREEITFVMDAAVADAKGILSNRGCSLEVEAVALLAVAIFNEEMARRRVPRQL